MASLPFPHTITIGGNTSPLRCVGHIYIQGWFRQRCEKPLDHEGAHTASVIARSLRKSGVVLDDTLELTWRDR